MVKILSRNGLCTSFAESRSGASAVHAIAPSTVTPTEANDAAIDLLSGLATAAADEDLGLSDICLSIAQLRRSGFLVPDAASTATLFRRLVRIAEVNLPVARLYEGHVNACRIILTLGDAAAHDAVRRQLASGEMFGVWGADATEPLAIDGDVLMGGKRFASGLGAISSALVTIGQGPAVRLALLDVSDPARHRPETWAKTGMRATASGDFVADGLPLSSLQWIGDAGQYFEEPGFIGGVWRIAAVQLGGTLGLLHAAARQLDALGRLGAEAQVARLAPILTRALAAGAFVEQAARVAEGPEGRADPARAASFSAQARLLTEDIGMDAIAAVERSIGLPHFDESAPTGRTARDLATYMRQAARDALLQQSGAWALQRSDRFSTLLGEG